MYNSEQKKITSEKSAEDMSGKEEIAGKIEALKEQEQVEKFGRKLERVGEEFEEITKDSNFTKLSDEKIPIEQKQNFWEKTRKLRIFMPLVISGVMSLAGLFGKGNGGSQEANNKQGESWNNLVKIGSVVSDMDKKQNIKMENVADPFGIMADK